MRTALLIICYFLWNVIWILGKSFDIEDYETDSIIGGGMLIIVAIILWLDWLKKKKI